MDDAACWMDDGDGWMKTDPPQVYTFSQKFWITVEITCLAKKRFFLHLK
jgi:hypothetical protein